MGQSNFDAMPYAEQANELLDKALGSAIPYSESYTSQAIEAQEYALQTARNDAEAAFQRAQGLSAPYRAAGYMALDTYMDTLTLARPEMGSLKLATALESNAKRDAALEQLRLDLDKAKDIGLAINAPSTYTDPNTGEVIDSPGIEAEKLANITSNMLKQGVFPSLNTSKGYIPMDAYFTGYMTSKLQRQLGMDPNTGKQLWGFSAAPTPRELTAEAADAYKNVVDRYNQATKYYTPEHGGIAASFQKGLFAPTRWVDVGTSPTLLGGIA